MQRLWPLWRLAKAIQWLVLLVSFYQTFITIAGHVAGALKGREASPSPARPVRFTLIVCARNEARVIGQLLDDLLAQEYPRDALQLLVVAHNCEDATAAVAARPGVRVIEAQTAQPGKRHAIRAALPHIPSDCEAIGVLDADSRVDATFLAAVAAAMEGETCIQVETVPQPSEGWLSHGYGLDRRARNLLWWKPRENLGLGVTASGSGFFLRASMARQLVPELHAVTEDLELTALLALAGHRVRFLSTTRIRLQEPHGLRPLVRQRARWARGHFGVARQVVPPLLARALRGDLRAADLALYLVLPTRVLTRTAVTLALFSTLVGAPWRLPLRAALAGMAGEWLVPAGLAAHARLVPLNLQGLRLAARLGVIGLLWFPIGVWAAVTSRNSSWDHTPREIHDGDRSLPVT